VDLRVAGGRAGVNIIAVVVTIDRPLVLKACLESLWNSSRRPDHAVVVDNGSVCPLSPPETYGAWVHVVRLNHNMGPAGGAACGQRQALDLGADWIWMVDDDAQAESDALSSLLTAQAKQPVSRTFFRSICVESEHVERPFYNAFTYSRYSGLLKPIPRESYSQERFAFDACGMAGLFISATLLREIGVFDASLYGWYDDTEFTLRATRAGFCGQSITASRLRHPMASRRTAHFLGRSFTVLADKPERLYYGTRNCILTQRSMLSTIRFALVFMPIFSVRRFLTIVLLYNNRRAFLGCFIKGIFDGMHNRRGELAQGGHTR